ncbi:MAG: hypothetical protein IJ960_06165 [Oscillospiraceae bacterium]|nr:hypothetical protein [Oscillospiraceae bacterium]
MTSYYQTRRTQNLLGGHICSRCRSIIITEFIVVSIANSRWSQKKAQEGAEEAAQKALEVLAACQEKPFLVTYEYEDRTYSLISGFYLEGLNNTCPYCGNRERWQNEASFSAACKKDPQTGVYVVSDVPQESRLMVFDSNLKMKSWQSWVLSAYQGMYQQYWAGYPNEAVQIREYIQWHNQQISALEYQKENCHETSRWLYSQLVSKGEELKGYSLFSGDRKRCKAEYRDLEKQYETQKAQEAAQEKELLEQLRNLDSQRRAAKIDNPGVMGETETVSHKTAPNCMAVRCS